MILDIQLFGGRGQASTGKRTRKASANTEPKRATFQRRIGTDRSGEYREEVDDVKGVAFKYKDVNIGVFNASQKAYGMDKLPSRTANRFIGVVITDNETNGVSLATGRTQKEAIKNVKDLIDSREKEIKKAIKTNTRLKK